MEANTATAAGDVLVVDDNRLNLTAIEAALEGTFVNVVQAQSGDAALRLLLDRDFALILLDVQMPTLDGFETARLIRQRPRTRHTPIIFVTAHSRADAEIRHAYELGAVDFLFKPLVPEVLQAKATVFVNLRMQRLEVERQALLLRDHERKEHERRLEDERRRWEEEALRRQVEEERRTASEVARKADELARAVKELEMVRGALTDSNRELAASDKRKTEFIAVLAHELRNPLAPIVTSLELIRQTATPTDNPITTKAWQVIERQVAQLGRLVDDLLDVSRITSDKIELRKSSIALSELIDQATATSKPAIDRAGHSLLLETPEQDVTLYVDPVRIVQVLSNLLNNAARYTERGGEIRLTAVANEHEVLLTVQDNGRGMSPESLTAVFDMFMQEHRGGGGLGIGLTLVKRLVELHGGSVEASSGGIGQGSTFTVKLPLGTFTLQEAEASMEPPASTRPMRIVLVEDNADIRETVRALLESWGHFVEEADTGPKGVELILASRPSVALVDIGLPDMDGCQVARTIRQRLTSRQVRLIAMTGYGQDSDRQRIQAAGFDAHLVKPADAKTLQSALANASLRMGSHES